MTNYTSNHNICRRNFDGNCEGPPPPVGPSLELILARAGLISIRKREEIDVKEAEAVETTITGVDGHQALAASSKGRSKRYINLTDGRRIKASTLEEELRRRASKREKIQRNLAHEGLSSV